MTAADQKKREPTRKPPDRNEIARDLFSEHLDIDRISRVIRAQNAAGAEATGHREHAEDPSRDPGAIPTADMDSSVQVATPIHTHRSEQRPPVETNDQTRPQGAAETGSRARGHSLRVLVGAVMMAGFAATNLSDGEVAPDPVVRTTSAPESIAEPAQIPPVAVSAKLPSETRPARVEIVVPPAPPVPDMRNLAIAAVGRAPTMQNVEPQPAVPGVRSTWMSGPSMSRIRPAAMPLPSLPVSFSAATTTASAPIVVVRVQRLAQSVDAVTPALAAMQSDVQFRPAVLRRPELPIPSENIDKSFDSGGADERDTVLTVSLRPRARPVSWGRQATQPVASGTSSTRMVIHYSNRTSKARAETIAQELRQSQFGQVELRSVNFDISKDNVRYFFIDDLAAARQIGVLIEANGGSPAIRDFTSFSPLPRNGTIEIWVSS